MKALMLVLALLPASAGAVDLEVDAGLCRYTNVQGTGDWWQGSSFEYKDKQAPGCGSVSVAMPLTDKTLWTLGYSNLGQYRIDERARDASRPALDPHWTAQGYSNAQGITAGIARDFSFARLEAGLLIYESQWIATAYHIEATRENLKSSLRYGIAPYIGAKLNIQITRSISATAGARYYRHVYSNRTWNSPAGDGSDNIGYRRADVLMPTIGLRIDL